MNLREEILAEHSKAQRKKIVKWIGESQERFDELFHLFLEDEYRVVQRAAWPLSYSVIAHPVLVKKHFGKLVKNLHKPGIHDSVKRNTVRLLQFVQIPAKFHGEIMDLCFQYINAPTEPVAVKAFALTVLENLAKFYPDIRQEIKLVIEEKWEVESAAFRVRAKKILKNL